MKKYTISFILFLIGILCAIIYQFKGSSVDVNGFLQEPFYLAATSSIAIWAGLFSMLGISLFNLKKGEKLDKTFAIISGVAIFLGLISSVISYKYIYKNEDNRGQAVITNSTKIGRAS
ncbi:MAG: hypothetical protein QG614_285, partial [Patescibacteria group bacterium]|nr:hypothetical protein [Patescibacteria group bacterium]